MYSIQSWSLSIQFRSICNDNKTEVPSFYWIKIMKAERGAGSFFTWAARLLLLLRDTVHKSVRLH